MSNGITPVTGTADLTTDQFVETINKLRLDNKGKWFAWVGTVNGKAVRVKCYNTYLQIFDVGSLHVSTGMDMKPTAFKEALRKGVA